MAKSSLRKEEFPDLQAGLVPGTGEKTESLSQTWKNACEPRMYAPNVPARQWEGLEQGSGNAASADTPSLAGLTSHIQALVRPCCAQ